MKIKLNGQGTEITNGLTLLGIIEEKGLLPERIVVEHNQEIVSCEKLGEICVKESDSIEIVSFVGGG